MSVHSWSTIARYHAKIVQCAVVRTLELELIQTQMTQKPMLRVEVGMRVRCVAQTKQVRNDSGGREALAKFLGNFAKSEVFVGVAHSSRVICNDSIIRIAGSGAISA